MQESRRSLSACSAPRARWAEPWWPLATSAALVLSLACSYAQEEPHAPAAASAPAGAPAAKPPGAPETALRISSAPIEALRSPYFSALEIIFQNPSGQWHQVRRVTIGPERQLFGPALEALVGERLRAWQLAAREAWQSKEPRHPALETLAPDAAPKSEPGSVEAAAAAPPNYLLAGPFTVAPGLFTRKWVVLYAAAPDALLGQDLVLSYELENGKAERVLVQYPRPAPKP